MAWTILIAKDDDDFQRLAASGPFPGEHESVALDHNAKATWDLWYWQNEEIALVCPSRDFRNATVAAAMGRDLPGFKTYAEALVSELGQQVHTLRSSGPHIVAVHFGGLTEKEGHTPNKDLVNDLWSREPAFHAGFFLTYYSSTIHREIQSTVRLKEELKAQVEGHQKWLSDNETKAPYVGIVDAFLPLAIDIQGLGLVEESKFEEYLEAVLSAHAKVDRWQHEDFLKKCPAEAPLAAALSKLQCAIFEANGGTDQVRKDFVKRYVRRKGHESDLVFDLPERIESILKQHDVKS